MIVDMIRGDIFADNPSDVAFAVNTEGYNDAGFAGFVTSKYWPELANSGESTLGHVWTLNVPNRRLHAIVCHSLNNGWDNAPEIIEETLNNLSVYNDRQPVSIVAMGGGMIGQMQGANLWANLGAIARAKPSCKVYTL
jgi:hypothetical protein